MKTSLSGKKLSDKELVVEINKGCTGCIDRSSIGLFAATGDTDLEQGFLILPIHNL